MSRRLEIGLLLVADLVAFALATWLFYMARFQWGWLGPVQNRPEWVGPAIAVLSLYWLLLFVFFGQYQPRFAQSRFDELVNLAKVITIGLLVLFFLLFVDDPNIGSARKSIPFYWVSVFGTVAGFRFLVRSYQRWRLVRGLDAHRALIVGTPECAEMLYREVEQYPAQGLKIVGFVPVGEEPEGSEGPVLVGTLPVVGRLQEITRLVERYQIQDVLVALEATDRERLLEVIERCDGLPVSLKVLPDFYDIISGFARTNEIYGLPFIDLMPAPMPVWEQYIKRLIDVGVSFLILVGGLPLWVLIAVLIRLDSPGPAIFRQERVGRGGRLFIMYKFRTMRQDAERETGPVWAAEDDPRLTRIGRWLRKTRLDEIPQFWNVLKGDMSLVGPRPERPYFVEKLSQEIPLYRRRLRVKPGITGWAQVRWRYDSSIEDVRQKVKYDLFYIANMSLRMDLKIMLRTIYVMLTARGR